MTGRGRTAGILGLGILAMVVLLIISGIMVNWVGLLLTPPTLGLPGS